MSSYSSTIKTTTRVWLIRAFSQKYTSSSSMFTPCIKMYLQSCQISAQSIRKVVSTERMLTAFKDILIPSFSAQIPASIIESKFFIISWIKSTLMLKFITLIQKQISISTFIFDTLDEDVIKGLFTEISCKSTISPPSLRSFSQNPPTATPSLSSSDTRVFFVYYQMEYNRLLQENVELKKSNQELETTLAEIVKQNTSIDRVTLMKNFVLVSTEVERLSRAYVALERKHLDDMQKCKEQEQLGYSKIEQLLYQIEQLNDLVLKLQGHGNLTHQIKEANSKISMLLQLNQTLESNEVRLQQEKQKLQQKLFDSNQELSSVMQTLKECEGIFKTQLANQNNIVSKLEAQIKQLNGDVDKKDKQIESLIKSNKDLIRDLEAMDKKHKDVLLEYKELQKEFEKQQEGFQIYKAQQHSNFSDLNNLNKRIDQKNQMISDLEGRLDRQTFVLREMDTQIQDKDFRLTTLQQQKGELGAQIKQLEESIQQIQKAQEIQNQENKETIQRLQEKVTLLKKEGESDQLKRSELEELLKIKETDISKYQQQLTVLKKDQQQMKQVVLDLTQSLNVQNEMFQRSQLEAASLKESLLSVQDTSNQLRQAQLEDEVYNLSQDAQAYQQQLNYYKHQCFQLQQQVEDLRETKNYLSNILMSRSSYY